MEHSTLLRDQVDLICVVAIGGVRVASSYGGGCGAIERNVGLTTSIYLWTGLTAEKVFLKPPWSQINLFQIEKLKLAGWFLPGSS